MNETERAALVDELAEAIVDEGTVRGCLPIIDRLLAAGTAPGLDELLDSVGAVGVAIERLKQGGKPTTLWGATLYTDRFEYTGDKERSPMRALNGAVKHAREDAIIAAAVAQATEGAER